ncbi:MAG TPA: caspase family protein [Candidatus Methylomirabilis sp.]|nr:caspase family protein [Candidatus Methylomirabilis sp.]
MVNKKALLVGINTYIPPAGPNLSGCVNDVEDMANTLNALEIVPANPGSMRIITNTRATRDAILEGIKWLIEGAQKDDVLIWYYSGHGSKVADVSGEDIDGYDESICPSDVATAGDLIDDDIREALSGLAQGAHLEVIFDSCHSGTATREFRIQAVVPDEPELAIRYATRYMPPPADWSFFLDSNSTIPRRGIMKPESGKREAKPVTELNHVLWAACKDFQTSSEVDIEGKRRGVFTYHFCKVLRRAGVETSRRKLDDLVTVNVKSYGQDPQLEGAEEKLDINIFT